MFITNMYCMRSILKLRYSLKNCNKTLVKGNVLVKSYKIEQCNYYATNLKDESDRIVDSLCNADPELEKKLRILMLEVEVMRQDGRCAPNTLKTEHWEHLMSLDTRNQRSKYLIFLWKTEKSRENEKAKKEARRKEFEERIPAEKEHPDDLIYGIQDRSLFLRIRDASINNFDNYRTLQSMTYGVPLVIDCSYEEHMVHREIINAAKQMTIVFGDNRLDKEPFNIHMCNVNFEGIFMKHLQKNIPNIDEPWFPMNIHCESYMDIFPKDKLVYLTPHCREELTNFDSETIYIVGCMVDKINNEPFSLAKAKRDGIRMAKLPLDRYLEWAPGAKKNLNINHMIPILLDLKHTGDWEFSLRHIPRRKLMETKIFAMQKRINNPLLRNTVLENYKKYSNLGQMARSSFKDKRSKSRKSLYDDDNI